MSEQLLLTHFDVEERAAEIAGRLEEGAKIFPIPRGGVPVAYLIQKINPDVVIVDDPAQADHFIDDLIDSGHTMDRWLASYPRRKFHALYDKRGRDSKAWIVFPWEAKRSDDDSITGTITNRFREEGVSFLANDNISRHLLPGEMEQVEAEVEKRAQALLESLLIDTANDHNSKGTAKRMAKMFCREVFKGRFEDRPRITDFPNAKQLDELYITGPITIRSACSHHFCPIIGKAWIGVLPGTRVIGLSKFNRLVDWVCSRPQIQEEMAIQVADELEKAIGPLGLAVVIKASHSCMTWRGVQESPEAMMTTNIMRGAFRENFVLRAEFMASIKE